MFLGVFIARGKEDALVTKNLVPGDSVYGEKRITVEVKYFFPNIFKKNYSIILSDVIKKSLARLVFIYFI